MELLSRSVLITLGPNPKTVPFVLQTHVGVNARTPESECYPFCCVGPG